MGNLQFRQWEEKIARIGAALGYFSDIRGSSCPSMVFDMTYGAEKCHKRESRTTVLCVSLE
jgi:hypothetical protein